VARPQLEHDDAGASFRREPRHLSEIMVERDENASFARACLEQSFVLGAAEALVAHGHHVVARRFEQLPSAASNVFVELELHARPVIGTGMMRSRAASAP
jgi:hypothetical protein